MNTDPDKLVDEKTGTPTPGVPSFSQAKQWYDDFIKDNRQRNTKNARITRKRDGEQPFNPRKLKAAGQSWRNNRPTGFMESLLKRLHSPYKQMADQLPKLTYSNFPVDGIGTDKERDIFCQAITDHIRGSDGWSDFLSQLIAEDIDFGYAAVSWASEYDWKPDLYRSDEALFPVGCRQNAADIPMWGLKRNLKTYEVMEIIKGGQTSKDAGWILSNLMRKLNIAPKEFDNRTTEDNERIIEDLVRENSHIQTTTSSVKVIKAGEIFVMSKDGSGVHHYIFDREDGTPLFYRASRYSKMEHSTCLFTAEVGDRTLHGSRGAGRAIYNTHVSVEQARNLIQDALHLSGLVLLKKTARQGNGTTENVALSVQHPFAILGDGFEVVEKVKFEVNAEAFFALDRAATSQAEILVGAFMPGQVDDEGGPRRTASEINYVASIEAQIRAGILARFADQLFSLITQLQRRICHPDVIAVADTIYQQVKSTKKIPIMDKGFFDSLVAAGASEEFIFAEIPEHIPNDSVATVLKMLQDGLTKTQIIVLANVTSRASVEDAIASQSGILDMIVARYSVDPMVDTVELKRRDIASKLGSEAAERLMNVDLNPLGPLKQVRTQISEMASMLSGNDTPVDPTDDDKIHLEVIVSRVASMVSDPTVSPLASTKEFIGRVVMHADQHVEAALGKGVKQEELSEFMPVLEQMKAFLETEALDTQAAAAVEQMSGPGISVNGAPPPPVTASEGPAAPMTDPASVLDQAASPPRPTPQGGLRQVPVPLIAQPSERQP
jgi:hypothetical protein